MSNYQTIDTVEVKRNDHVWVPVRRPGPTGRINRSLPPSHYKCCLCGAITHDTPPPFPTPTEWMPDHYELPLTKEERGLLPPLLSDLYHSRR